MALTITDDTTEQIVYEHHWDKTWTLEVRTGTIRLASSRSAANRGGGREINAGNGIENWTPHKRWFAHAQGGDATIYLTEELDYADDGGSF